MVKKNFISRRKVIGIINVFLIGFCLIMIYLMQFQADIKKIEQDNAAQHLSDLALHGADIIENLIEKEQSVLKTTAQILKYKEISNEDVVKYLEEIRKTTDSSVERFGIIDKEGNAKITDGREMNLSRKDFFKESIQGKEYISKLVREVDDVNNIVVSVPVFDRDQSVKAVLYGVIQTEKFHIYTDTILEKWDDNKYIHIIDGEGNYIVHSYNKNSLMKGKNLYKDLELLNSPISVEEIKKTIYEEKTVVTQIKSGEEARYVYFAPIKVNNWCVVTVLNSQIIEEQVEYSQKMVRSLILRIIITILIISVIYYKKFVEEKESNDDLSRELNITDKMLRTAISKTREYVFSYDVNTGKLEFLNYDGLHKDMPRVITDFPKNFRKYINGEEKSYKEIERLLEGASQGKREMEGEVSIVQEGKNVIFRIQFTNIVDEDKKSVRVVGTMENITNMRQNEVSLQREEQIRAAILSNTIGFFEIDLNKDHLMQKGELKETKYTFSEIMKEFVERRVDEPYRESVKENFDVERMIHRYHTGVYDNSLEFIRINADGMKLWVRAETRLEKDIVTGDIIALIVVKNIHNEKMQEINLRTQARLDPLTQAYNRGVSVSRINEVLYEYPNQTHAFMLVDLDNFKLINDSLGHVIGDVVLVDVVKILKNHVRERDIVCRLGGDEFGVFLVDIPEEAIARNVTSLIKKLNIKYEKDGKSKLISVSVGIAVAPEHGTTFESLYEKADIAMYEVKNKGKNNYKIYDLE